MGAVCAAKGDSRKMSLRRNVRGVVLGAVALLWLSLCVPPFGLAAPAVAQSEQPLVGQGAESGTSDDGGTGSSAAAQEPDRPLPGNISGTVVVQTGAAAAGAQVQLTHDDQSPKQEVISGDNGQYSFANVPPGPFHITISAPGFATHVFDGTLQPGQAFIVPEVMLSVETAVTEVRVEMTPVEVAEEQLKEQEKQRVFGIIPNFYVTYVPDPAPLIARQKFQLAFRSVIDPFTFFAVGFLAGLQQASDQFSGYGQGAEGYAKRYGAAYADVVVSTYIGSAILPSLLKQDPRYFYKGTGTIKSRTMYALANSVICKGDNKKWQPNYSEIIGAFATGGISYLYYPASDRHDAIWQNALIKLGESSIAGLFQEFVLRRLTPHLQTHSKSQP
jgi:Carboxypeptidase regulatory-like domain